MRRQLRVKRPQHAALFIQQLHEDAVQLAVARRRREAQPVGVSQDGGTLLVDGVELLRLAREKRAPGVRRNRLRVRELGKSRWLNEGEKKKNCRARKKENASTCAVWVILREPAN